MKPRSIPSKGDALDIFKEAWCRQCPIFELLQPGATLESVKPLCPPPLIETCPSYIKILAFQSLMAAQAADRETTKETHK
ncbi:MAG: hypothetical protein GX025_10575 [Clostridiales bacterium]|nr:hypothetical protein [Clostridiales bacterium]